MISFGNWVLIRAITASHGEVDNQLRCIVRNLIFDLKIKESSVDVRSKAIEIACELAISDDDLSNSEHDII